MLCNATFMCISVVTTKRRFQFFNTCFSCLIIFYNNITHLNRIILTFQQVWVFFPQILIKKYLKAF